MSVIGGATIPMASAAGLEPRNRHSVPGPRRPALPHNTRHVDPDGEQRRGWIVGRRVRCREQRLWRGAYVPAVRRRVSCSRRVRLLDFFLVVVFGRVVTACGCADWVSRSSGPVPRRTRCKRRSCRSRGISGRCCKSCTRQRQARAHWSCLLGSHCGVSRGDCGVVVRTHGRSR